jgi:hypothetical protein
MPWQVWLGGHDWSVADVVVTVPSGSGALAAG